MKKKILGFFTIALLCACNTDDNSSIQKTDYFAIANRTSGTVTIYDAETQIKTSTITLEDDEAPSPTYIVYSNKRDIFYVADFNNQKVIGYSADTFLKVEEFTTQKGSFHMWLNDTSNQLWVNNIQSKTTSVIDLNTSETVQTIALPSSIAIAPDTAQHDVIISPDGNFAYVSVFSQTSANYVLQYNTTNFNLLNTEIVGGDPHLTVTDTNLYILSQNDSNIKEYNFNNLSSTGNSGTMANAHGVTIGKNNTIYMTNISERKIGAYNITSQTTSGITDSNATSGVAHNLAYNSNANILALTLSGSNTVDFFTANGSEITFLSSDNSGENPFGIVYMDR